MHAHMLGRPVVMVDRPVFWAELGLVSPPALLVRIGGYLQACAARDEELSKAMQLAARHVQQECLVWAPYMAGVPHDAAVPSDVPWTSSQDSNGNSGVTSEMPLLNNVHSQLEPINALRPSSEREDLLSVDSRCSISTSCSGDDQSRPTPFVMSQIFARHPLVKLLPGIGHCPCHVVWILAMTVTACFFLCRAFLPSAHTRIHFGWLSVWVNLGRMQELFFSLVTFATIPMLCASGRLWWSEAWRRALKAELDSSSGEEFRHYLPKAIAITALVFLAHLPHCLVSARGDRWMLILDIVAKLVINFVHAACFIGFLLLWKLSSNGVSRLRDRTLLASMSGTGWATLMEEYGDYGQLLYGVWTETGMSLVAWVSMMVRLVFLCWIMAIQIAVPNCRLMAWNIYVTICDTTLLCTVLYLMADISSRINSNRHSKRSVLEAALQCPGGCVSAQEAFEHLRFVQSVQMTRCGIEVPVFGKVSMARVAPLVRILGAAIPVCFGLALKLAQKEAD